MEKTILLCIALNVVLFTCHIEMVAVNLTCPTLFTDGQSNYIICNINTEDVSKAQCAADPTTVTFQITGAESNGTACTVPYDASQCNSPLPEGKRCGCTATHGSVKTFVLKYIGNEAKDKGATFKCSVCAGLNDSDVHATACAAVSFGADDTTTLKDTTTTSDTSGVQKIQITMCEHGILLSAAVILSLNFVDGFFV